MCIRDSTGGIDKGDGVKVKTGSVSFPKVFLKKSNVSGMKRSSSISFGINNKNINNFQQENLVEQQDQDNGSASSPSQKNKRNVWSSLKRSNSMTCGINKINMYSEKSKDQRKINQINGNVYIEEHIDRKLETRKLKKNLVSRKEISYTCLLYTSPSPRDKRQSRMPSSA